ncbi:MAG: GxxExxY protein [Sedimentisphaerales bacterium]|nr:GxxExxY protein [Sedimentisphaerales bacterium]
MDVNEVTCHVVDAAMKVHSALGPGLLESAYEACLQHELIQRGFDVKRQLALPVTYDSIQVDAGYRLDLLVADTVIVELKAVSELIALHKAQLLSYLKLSGKKVGLLINFNVVHLREGIKRMVNEL